MTSSHIQEALLPHPSIKKVKSLQVNKQQGLDLSNEAL